MTVHVQTLTNPGAEAAATTGWTSYGDALGVGTAPNGIGPHSGTYCFFHNDGFLEDTGQYQDVAVAAPLEAAIDAGIAGVRVSGWYNNDGFDPSGLFVQFYDAGAVLLGTVETNEVASSPANTWAQHEIYAFIPEDTRTVRIGTSNHTGGFASRVRWDDFEMDISDDGDTDWPAQLAPHASQLGVYAVGTFPTADTKAHQLPIAVVASAETSNTFHDFKSHQLGAYALVRGKIDRRDLRAWPFTQDDHDFWVLQLGDVGTLVFDKLTGQWAQWRSPGFAYWRGNDGVQWEGWNICCDSESGVLWIIDPEGRLDDETTPITSVVSGKVGVRMRRNSQCHMAELAVSEQEPPTGIDASTLTITLRTSDDDGHTYLSHGSVAGEDIGDDITVRWYGLGVMPAPGRVFEITDTGYARRLDGLNIEVGEEPIG